MFPQISWTYPSQVTSKCKGSTATIAVRAVSDQGSPVHLPMPRRFAAHHTVLSVAGTTSYRPNMDSVTGVATNRTTFPSGQYFEPYQALPALFWLEGWNKHCLAQANRGACDEGSEYPVGPSLRGSWVRYLSARGIYLLEREDSSF